MLSTPAFSLGSNTMTPGQVTFLVFAAITVAAFVGILFMQRWVNKRLEAHDKDTDARVNDIDQRLKTIEDEKAERESPAYPWNLRKHPRA